MLANAIINEFALIFNDDSLEIGFSNLIKNAMSMIENSRELIGDDELMYMIINPIANSIMTTIAIMLDDDDADAIARGTDLIGVMIMDSMID